MILYTHLDPVQHQNLTTSGESPHVHAYHVWSISTNAFVSYPAHSMTVRQTTPIAFNSALEEVTGGWERLVTSAQTSRFVDVLKWPYTTNCSNVYKPKKLRNIQYTHCVTKKYTPWCSTLTLANMDRFSKFFHQMIRGKILYVHTHTQISTSPAICCYITLWNSKIQKVTEFSRWTWQLICLTKICCKILRNVPQNIALMILIKYVYNTWSIV